MHEAEPLLYWRVRRNGTWKFERAMWIRYPRHPNDLDDDNLIVIAAQYPKPKVNESGGESD